MAGLEEEGDHTIRSCGGEKHWLMWKQSSGNSEAADSADGRFYKRPLRYPPPHKFLQNSAPPPPRPESLPLFFVLAVSGGGGGIEAVWLLGLC